MSTAYPCSGLLAPGTSMNWQRSDQGRDMVIPWQGVWQAAGDGECVEVRSDAAFPNGFGPDFPLVHFANGPFSGNDAGGNPLVWYFGHCTALVKPGDRFGFGHPIARADQGHDFEGTHGGWTELGLRYQPWDGGRLGPYSPSGHWFDPLLQKALIVPDATLQQGSKGWRVFRLTSQLQDCGYLTHRGSYFDGNVKVAVQRFQTHHHQTADGVVGALTQATLDHSTAYCKQHHTTEV